jgi:hypothetical protein
MSIKVKGNIKVLLTDNGFWKELNIIVKFKEPNQIFYRTSSYSLADNRFTDNELRFYEECKSSLEDRDMLTIAKRLIMFHYSQKRNSKMESNRSTELDSLIKSFNNSKQKFEFDIKVE